MSYKKVIHTCAVNGELGTSLCGKYSDLCNKISGTSNQCTARTGLICKHKVKDGTPVLDGSSEQAPIRL